MKATKTEQWWGRVPSPTLCGHCNTQIATGSPARFSTIALIDRIFVRCPLCVGPAPPDLPPLVVQTAEKPLMPVPSGPEWLPLDFKARASGEEG